MSLTNLYLIYFYENFDLLHLINFMSPLINNNRENNIKISKNLCYNVGIEHNIMTIYKIFQK